jgi:hypothetical protein
MPNIPHEDLDKEEIRRLIEESYELFKKTVRTIKGSYLDGDQ